MTIWPVYYRSRTYALFDLQQILSTANQMMESSGGMIEMRIDDPQVFQSALEAI